MKKVLLSLLLGLLVFRVSLFQPSFAHEGHNDAFAGENQSSASGGKKIRITPEGQKAIGIKVQPVSTASFLQTLKATGRVKAAGNRAFDINPQVRGAVRQVYVKEGDTVHVGQTLATLYSLDIAETLTQLLRERATIQAEIARTRTQAQRDIAVQLKSLELARVTFAREKTLYKEGISAQRDYVEAKNAMETAQVQLAAMRRQASQDVSLSQQQLRLTTQAVKSQLNAQGLSGTTVNKALATNRVSAEVPIISPVKGTVTFRDITLGETLDPAKRIFSIVGLNPIWVEVDIYQEQIPKIHLGQTARIQTPSGQVISGQISSIGTVVDATRRTLPVRIISNNLGNSLKPGMFVTAQIVTGQTAGSNLMLPLSALVEENGLTQVYLKSGNDFKPVSVQAGQRSATEVEIRIGIKEGDNVVIQGARQIYAQSLLGESQKTVSDEAEATPHEHTDDHAINPWWDRLLGLASGLFAAGLIFTGWKIYRRKTVPFRTRKGNKE